MGQTPGYIFNPSTTVNILDPNLDHYTSKTNGRFVVNDLTESEISFFPLPHPGIEPTSDLRRGSNGSITDIVPDANGEGAYMFFDNTNLVFRLRTGGYTSGVFGFSILIDADMKFGNVGASADPNYQAQTTGTNGNPGFEYEICFEKGKRVAVYNVDGGSSPVLLSTYVESTHTQYSKALTTNNVDGDYFDDFYVPLSALTASGVTTVTATTPIRLVATTSMNAAPAIGGTKSDIYGVNDSDYPVVEDAWTTIAISQPGFTPNQVGTGGGGSGALCTAAPTLTGPIATGVTSVSGTWTTTSAATTATIKVYKGAGTLLGTLNSVASGTTWTLNSITPALSSGDIVYVKAVATGESECLQSNLVTVQGCIPATTTAVPTITCFSDRGARGTMVTGATINIYQVTSTGIALVTATNMFYPSTTSTYFPTLPAWGWYGNNTPSVSNDPCGGNTKHNLEGTFYVTATAPGQCESPHSAFWCLGPQNVVTTASPVISQTNLYTTSTVVSGTAPNPSTVRIFVNGFLKGTISSTGTYSFTGLSLYLSDAIEVTAQAASQCMSTATTKVVTCYSTPPIINADASNKVVIGSAIKGTSSENAGTTVTVYNGSNVSLGTCTVQSNGTWTSTVTAAIGTTYYARQTAGSCGQSDASATVSTLTANSVCPVITSPVNEGASSVSGTVSSASNQTINLYEDGSLIGNVVTSNGSWTIPVSSPYSLYAGGILTATSQVIGTNVESTCSQNILVACVAPAPPTVAVTAYTTCYNSTISVSVSGTSTGVLYTLKNNALFTVQPAVDATGTLSYTPALNQSGNVTVSVQLTDNGSILNGGVSTSPVQSFTITINALPAAPSGNAS